ncbi:MAG: hypothetical protein IKN17_05810 [Ruminococcus sp.]|nr:hypothetical protein [Ruminococcus sp.]
MNYKMFIAYIGDYKELGSAEQLLGQIGFPPDEPLTAEGLATAVDIIAAVAELDVKKLIEISGLTMRSFAAKYQIPYRTMQDWCSGAREPAEYIPMLIGWEMISELPKEDV